MSQYILHFLDLTGSVRDTLKLECENDQQAVAIVLETLETEPMELWQGERRVAFFLAGQDAPASSLRAVLVA